MKGLLSSELTLVPKVYIDSTAYLREVPCDCTRKKLPWPISLLPKVRLYTIALERWIQVWSLQTLPRFTHDDVGGIYMSLELAIQGKPLNQEFYQPNLS